MCKKEKCSNQSNSYLKIIQKLYTWGLMFNECMISTIHKRGE